MCARLFVGVGLSGSLDESLLRACAAIRELDVAWRDAKWVPETNLHLTLVFLGNVAEDGIAGLCEELDSVAESHRPFELPPGTIRAVPSSRRCTMIWSAFPDPEGACEALARDLSRVTQPATPTHSAKPFRAHVTLCRARRPRPIVTSAIDEANKTAGIDSSLLSVPSFTLFASRLTSSGAVYTERRTWPLQGR